MQHELQQVEAFEESKSKYRKIVNAGIRQWVQDFQDGNIRINTVDDLKNSSNSISNYSVTSFETNTNLNQYMGVAVM
ncbi:hypothetical protein [Halalkalibacterium halodurans]|uniref:hypothetical protein n=1 Tax=Halalkalibacterium halodurans TaxID=86665 RepID=UPI000A8DB16F